MKKKIIKAVIGLVTILLFAHGFSEGMEWHRIAACSLGGVCLCLLALK